MQNKERGKRVKGIVFAMINIGLFIGAFVPLLVDFVKDGRLENSIIAVGAMIMSWFIISPWFIFAKNRFGLSWTAAILSVPIFLYIVESLSKTKGWFFTLGLPSAAAGLTVIGVIAWLWIGGRLKLLFAASLSVFLIAILGVIEYLLARPYLYPDPYESVRYLVLICLLSVSVLLAIIAFVIHGFKPFKEKS